MWRTLREVADSLPELDAGRLDRLIERAERQIETLHELRSRAGREAFAESARA
jgi:hypothetical protein